MCTFPKNTREIPSPHKVTPLAQKTEMNSGPIRCLRLTVLGQTVSLRHKTGAIQVERTWSILQPPANVVLITNHPRDK